MTSAYTLNNLDFRYADTETPALSIQELEIPANRITVLVGPNGSGKSTLLGLLAFLYTPEEGRLLYQGQEVAVSKLRDYRRRVGLVPQNPYLLHDSVSTNIEIGLKIRGTPARKRRALVQTVMEQLGLDHLADRPARELSGGEGQKVAIARALVLDPEVLLFDEPFTYLDKSIVAEFEQLIDVIREHRSQTIVLSSHDQIRAHALADQVVTLFEGRIAPTSLVNHFQGRVDPHDHVFRTGRIDIEIPEDTPAGLHAAVEANQIVISPAPLKSSMRNHFEGRITSLHEQHGLVNVTVQAGETFHVLITGAALRELDCHLGDDVIDRLQVIGGRKCLDRRPERSGSFPQEHRFTGRLVKWLDKPFADRSGCFNRPINQSTDQPINAINQSTERPIDQSADRPIDQSTKQLRQVDRRLFADVHGVLFQPASTGAVTFIVKMLDKIRRGFIAAFRVQSFHHGLILYEVNIESVELALQCTQRQPLLVNLFF
ncbi:MAG: ATP-binding cassette domain-containing protein [Gammaproteobacteria bacterium]|nr:ATP-binding cassette domain-containing protein [Gammaproteobacteria bacterium]